MELARERDEPIVEWPTTRECVVCGMREEGRSASEAETASSTPAEDDDEEEDVIAVASRALLVRMKAGLMRVDASRSDAASPLGEVDREALGVAPEAPAAPVAPDKADDDDDEDDDDA